MRGARLLFLVFLLLRKGIGSGRWCWGCGHFLFLFFNAAGGGGKYEEGRRGAMANPAPPPPNPFLLLNKQREKKYTVDAMCDQRQRMIE